MSNCPLHRAGRKIRRWRERENLSGAEFGEKVAAWVGRADPFPDQSVYNWEARGKVARPPIQRALAEHGICTANDWLERIGANAA